LIGIEGPRDINVGEHIEKIFNRGEIDGSWGKE
jgi:hypothetical protein